MWRLGNAWRMGRTQGIRTPLAGQLHGGGCAAVQAAQLHPKCTTAPPLLHLGEGRGRRTGARPAAACRGSRRLQGCTPAAARHACARWKAHAMQMSRLRRLCGGGGHVTCSKGEPHGEKSQHQGGGERRRPAAHLSKNGLTSASTRLAISSIMSGGRWSREAAAACGGIARRAAELFRASRRVKLLKGIVGSSEETSINAAGGLAAGVAHAAAAAGAQRAAAIGLVRFTAGPFDLVDC